MHKSEALANATWRPSGDQAALWPITSPRRRGEPPNTGRIHNGHSNSYAIRLKTRISEWFGEISSARAFGKGVWITTASPPVEETCARTNRPPENSEK